MDKHTLGQYGWAVIVVIIIAILLGCSTPFGNFIGGFVTDFVEKIDPFPGPRPEPDLTTPDPADNRPRTTSYLRNFALEPEYINETSIPEICIGAETEGITREQALWKSWDVEDKAAFENEMQAYFDDKGGNYETKFGTGITDYNSLVEALNNYHPFFPGDSEETNYLEDGVYKIIFENSLPASSVSTADVSVDHDGSIVAYVTQENFDGVGNKNVFHIAGNGVVKCGPDMTGFFQYFMGSTLSIIDFNNCFDTTELTTMKEMFSYTEGRHDLEFINFEGITTPNVTDMSEMFYLCTSLKELDLSSFGGGKVANINGMFNRCDDLEKIDMSNFDASNVADFSDLFTMVDNFVSNHIKSIKLTNFKTSGATNMSGMFGGCSKLTELDLSSFDTSNVTDMSYMFTHCIGLTEINLHSFRTDKVTNMNNMFSECTGLQHAYVAGAFNDDNATHVDTFKNCTSLSTIYGRQDFEIIETTFNMIAPVLTSDELWCIRDANDAIDGVYQAALENPEMSREAIFCYMLTSDEEEGSEPITNFADLKVFWEEMASQDEDMAGITFDDWMISSFGMNEVDFRAALNNYSGGLTEDNANSDFFGLYPGKIQPFGKWASEATKIVFESVLPDDRTGKIDITAKESKDAGGLVLAWLDSSKTLHIASDGITYANPESQDLFTGMSHLTEVRHYTRCLNPSKVINEVGMVEPLRTYIVD